MGERSGVDIEVVREVLSRVVRGKPDAIELLLVGVLSGGHILLEDVPGVGKTTLGKALALCFGADFARVQFTPDLLPADIVGAQILDPENGGFSFRAGPVFTHVLLADEINRASPRTQSALLEAMNELQVTVEGTTFPLPRPFCVIATQNPIGFQGTYPLPEAQLDRFGLCFGLGHPAPDVELDILYAHQQRDPLAEVEPVASVADLLATQDAVRRVRVKPDVARYMLQVVEATRSHPRIDLGVSTRGALAWFRAGQARAFTSGREYVSPDDFQYTAAPALAHRLHLATEARYAGKTAAAMVAELLEEVDLPL
ncbi:MAG: MoxR family ATPase [Myxococcota bacterium]|nr:MoxR family ATPase [Myxococcota bacterium]